MYVVCGCVWDFDYGSWFGMVWWMFYYNWDMSRCVSLKGLGENGFVFGGIRVNRGCCCGFWIKYRGGFWDYRVIRGFFNIDGCKVNFCF